MNTSNKKYDNWFYRLFFIIARTPQLVIGKDKNGKNIVKKTVYLYDSGQTLPLIYFFIVCDPGVLLWILWGKQHRSVVCIISMIWLTLVVVQYLFMENNESWMPYMKYYEQEPKDVRRKKAIVPLLIFLSLVTIFIIEMILCISLEKVDS